ncbi:MAG: polysaccharide biosynthesis C-terminal domain-containing protein [Planctomycetes bacterium]|nr:polysaccharide biosynthesis C-terminal domain-containing protein [Planctomycetota bacterium]
MTRIASATVALAINRFCPPVFGFLLLVVIALRSSELLGWYTVVTVFHFALQTLPFLGLTPLIVKEAARRPTDAGRIFATAVGLALAVTALMCLALPVVLHVAVFPDDVETAVWICALITVPYVVAYSAELILVSHNEPRLLGSVPLVENSLRFGASLVALELGYGITALFWFMFAGRVLAAVLFASALRNRVLRGLPMRCDPTLARTWLAQCPVFLLHAAMQLVTSRAAVVALGLVGGSIAVANFSVGYRVLDLGTVGLTAFAGAVYPGMAKAALAVESGRLHGITAIATKLALVMGTSLAILAVTGSELFVALLFPRQFPAAVDSMEILVLAFAAAGVRLTISAAMFARDRQRTDLIALLVGAAAYVLLLAWWVPLFGIAGAAAATVAEVVVQVGVRIGLARSEELAGGILRDGMGMTLAISALFLALSASTCLWIANPYLRLGCGTLCAVGHLWALAGSRALRHEDLVFIGLDRILRRTAVTDRGDAR